MGNAARVSVALIALAGCTTTTAIHPEEIGRLDGYNVQTSPAPRQIETLGGGKITFDKDTALYLDLGGESQGGRFAAIRAQDQTFEGRTLSGRDVRASITQIRSARVEQPNKAAPVIALLSVLALAAVVGLYVATQQTAHPTPTSGRPLRIESKIVVATPCGSEGWGAEGGEPDTTRLSPELRAALAEAWTTTATFEHASVPAFARISTTLVALGAPARLVEATHRAALDEIRHARLAFGLAAAYGGKPVAPGPLPDLQRAAAVTASTRAELAAETVVDGCLAEGVAAAAAEEAARRAADPVVRATLQAVAADEASHAELAWDIVRWCCEGGDAALGDRLCSLVDRAPQVVGPALPADLERQLEAHGHLGAAAWRTLGEEVRAKVTTRLAVFARPSP
ncbi:MAG TPA: hypothetical protein VKQ32_08185 [Polyangia bacterium]|nr:hypothetical protein [Polyangia bacterium]